MPLPANPPAWYHVDANTLSFNEDCLASKHGFWFWTYEGRSWAVGPYNTRRAAQLCRDNYLKMTDGPEFRVWEPSAVPFQPILDAEWRKFTPAYSRGRGTHTEPLGAHAFRADAPKSLCGYVKKERAGGSAEDSDRRCDWCKRVERGASKDLSHDSCGWG
jgi:hypothetical protein